MSLKPAVWLLACLFVLGLAGEARAETVDWSDYLEPKGARAKPLPLRDTPQVAKATPAKKQAKAKQAKKTKASAKARGKRAKPRRR